MEFLLLGFVLLVTHPALHVTGTCSSVVFGDHLALEENQEVTPRKYKTCLEVGQFQTFVMDTMSNPSDVIYHTLSKQREQIKSRW